MRVPLNALVLSDTKVVVESLSAMLQKPPGAVIDMVVTSYLASLPAESRTAIESIKAAAAVHAVPTVVRGVPEPSATYQFSRLCFRKHEIESLGPNESFRVVTPVGTFQMTKSEFYREFRNVVSSKSYSRDGIYHYPKLPARAERFRVA